MKRDHLYLLLVVVLLCLLPVPIIEASNSTLGTIEVKGKKMGFLSVGLDTRKVGEPVFIFECGLGSGAGSYMPLFSALSSNIHGLAYDRNGLGCSDVDTSLVSDADVVGRLHDLLTELQIDPPYIMVGHSIGGPLIRLFASIYPDEVSGLMFIDPTNFMLTKEDDEKVKITSKSQTGYRELLPMMFSEMISDNSTPQGVKQELIRVKRTHEKGYFNEYKSLPPLRNIPTVVLIAYNRRTEQSELQLSRKHGINLKQWFDELDLVRVRDFSRLINENDRSSVVLLPRYSHGIHHQDPFLVANYIQSLYDSVYSKKQTS